MTKITFTDLYLIDDDDDDSHSAIDDHLPSFSNFSSSILIPDLLSQKGMYSSNEGNDSEDESTQQQWSSEFTQLPLMKKMGVVEAAWIGLTRAYHLGIKEEVRNKVSKLLKELAAGKEKFVSALVQVENNTDAVQEICRKLDMRYQYEIAEALNYHLTTIRLERKNWFQIDESDTTLLEERVHQQKAKARWEGAEMDGKAAQESERVYKEGNVVMASKKALELEEMRFLKYKELEERSRLIISSSDQNFCYIEHVLARLIRQITASVENVRLKGDELVSILSAPAYPKSVILVMFAKKILLGNWVNTTAFACGRVIVHVAAQVPDVMDYLLAEFHKACPYTVPKYIRFSKSVFKKKEAYFKAIGYREEEGKLETTDQYLEHIESHMKLYGALIQTEVNGVRNIHGLEEGWIWLARFLNTLPSNLYTAVALEAFLTVAGFGLHLRYKSQFRKILDAISKQFVQELKESGDQMATSVTARLEDYIDSKKFLEEPDGWRFKESLLSNKWH